VNSTLISLSGIRNSVCLSSLPPCMHCLAPSYLSASCSCRRPQKQEPGSQTRGILSSEKRGWLTRPSPTGRHDTPGLTCHHSERYPPGGKGLIWSRCGLIIGSTGLHLSYHPSSFFLCGALPSSSCRLAYISSRLLTYTHIPLSSQTFLPLLVTSLRCPCHLNILPIPKPGSQDATKHLG
jgi:hypothetical protein